MLYFTKENQTLYPSNFTYNSALIIEELKKIVINNGGRVKERRPGYIVNRTLTEAIRETSAKIEKVEAAAERADDAELREKRTRYAGELRDKLNKYKSINNAPVLITSGTNIRFILDNYIYYYQFDENPFFDFYFTKSPIRDGEYSKDIPLESDKKEWMLDCHLFCTCTDEERREAANLIYNMLVSAPVGLPLLNRKRVRVPNIYDGGYHYEYKTERGRVAKIDF